MNDDLKTPPFSAPRSSCSVAQRGFTLIEAMLATLLLTMGMIAIAGMIEMSLGRNVGANQISLVTNLAADMVERIQFNRRNVTAYGGIDTLNIATRPASSQMMAQGDYDQWGARLTASGLGNVQGLVTVATVGPTNPPLNQSQVTVRINWSGSVRTHTLTVSTIVAPE